MPRTTIESESVISNKPARVQVFNESGELVTEILGRVEPQQGADGKLYPAVVLAYTDLYAKKTS